MCILRLGKHGPLFLQCYIYFLLILHTKAETMLAVMPFPFSPEICMCFGKTGFLTSWYSDSLYSKQEQEVTGTNSWTYSQCEKIEFVDNSCTDTIWIILITFSLFLESDFGFVFHHIVVTGRHLYLTIPYITVLVIFHCFCYRNCISIIS